MYLLYILYLSGLLALQLFIPQEDQDFCYIVYKSTVKNIYVIDVRGNKIHSGKIFTKEKIADLQENDILINLHQKDKIYKVDLPLIDGLIYDSVIYTFHGYFKRPLFYCVIFYDNETRKRCINLVKGKYLPKSDVKKNKTRT
ncbi:hypothetical protein NGRA_1751 [Nosema granulosis]|uniref:Uncharacterized protein n=1 Tax=Nosema granulosis TaxID=83296 RepID=A0A9P6KZA2_9MICR|nr:hypothetical protein NGRA_1751 [Nosema granulosis]